MKPPGVVVDDEQPRIGLMEETEAEVCRPEFCAVVVLNEGLGEEPRREVVGHAGAGQVRDETAPRQIDVVPAPPDRGLNFHSRQLSCLGNLFPKALEIYLLTLEERWGHESQGPPLPTSTTLYQTPSSPSGLVREEYSTPE